MTDEKIQQRINKISWYTPCYSYNEFSRVNHTQQDFYDSTEPEVVLVIFRCVSEVSSSVQKDSWYLQSQFDLLFSVHTCDNKY